MRWRGAELAWRSEAALSPFCVVLIILLEEKNGVAVGSVGKGWPSMGGLPPRFRPRPPHFFPRPRRHRMKE